MKVFFRLILIFLFAFFSIGIAPGNAEFNVSLVNREGVSAAGKHIYFNLQKNKDTIITTSINNNESEICASKNGSGGGSFSSGNAVTHNNLAVQQFKIYSNKIINSKSHNISSYLKNEICTRAP